jgi:hypothetical protein
MKRTKIGSFFLLGARPNSFYNYRMRMMSLFIVFFLALYSFLPRRQKGVTIDSIKTKLSAIQNTRPAQKQMALTQIQPEKKNDSNDADNGPVVSSNEDESEIQVAQAADSSVPWEELQKGWENDLKDTLIRLEPEDGEVIFNSYLQEKENHQTELDGLFQDKSAGVDKTRAPSEVSTDFDQMVGQVDQKHQERLKEILGAHYDEINKRHDEYEESIQHTNRDNAEISIGISL